MHFILATIGSAGDFNPFMGLALGLQAHGQQVTLLANEHFRPIAEKYGCGFFPLGDEAWYTFMTSDPRLWDAQQSFYLIAEKALLQFMRPVYHYLTQFDPQEVVLVTSGLVLGARLAQEKLGFKLATVHLQPVMLQSIYEPPIRGVEFPRWFPPWLNQALFNFLDWAIMDRTLGPEVNNFRAELGLPPTKHIFTQWLHSTDQVIGLFPEWYVPAQPDWPPHTKLTGFLAYDGELRQPITPELEAFIKEGEAPLIFTPGSAMSQGRDFYETSLAVVKKLQHKALFLTNYAENLPADLPSFVKTATYIPFRQLLPYAAVLVHHGGIGTTAQALKAGVPQLIRPLSHDQPDNARHLERLGVAQTLFPHQYTPGRVTAVLEQLLHSAEIRHNCQKWAQQTDFDQALELSCQTLISLTK